jgi:hypothetical protein
VHLVSSSSPSPTDHGIQFLQNVETCFHYCTHHFATSHYYTPYTMESPLHNRDSLEIRLQSRFNPSSWICKAFDTDSEYFDGSKDLDDKRYLIDLDTYSMERFVHIWLQVQVQIQGEALADESQTERRTTRLLPLWLLERHFRDFPTSRFEKVRD